MAFCLDFKIIKFLEKFFFSKTLMADNSDASEACSSTSEDEGTLEPHEYERRRELYMSKMIFCEKKFVELKPILLKLKLAEVRFFNFLMGVSK